MPITSGGQGTTTDAAVEAFRRGYTPVAVKAGLKAPHMTGWGNNRWTSEEQVRAAFEGFRADGVTNLGLLLGEGSSGLVDIDLDHPKTLRLKDYFLPPTPMQTGRTGRPRSHRWYIVKDNLPSYRKYTLRRADEVLVELRISGIGAGAHQTVIPPSIWTDKTNPKYTEHYRWEGKPWGGDAGPALIDGKVLAVQVALLALGAALLDNWPKQGGRHDAYLALAGGLLRFGDNDVHPWWEKNLPVLIGALADVTDDEDGASTRISEVMKTTIKRLRAGDKAIGFPQLGEYIGADRAEAARRISREIAQLAGFGDQSIQRVDTTATTAPAGKAAAVDPDAGPSSLPAEDRDPMEERVSSWSPVELEMYLTGEITSPEPELLARTDPDGPPHNTDAYLLYPGKVNSLFGLSESGKSWVAMTVCGQELAKGERVLYIDMEDEPATVISRMRSLGIGDDEIRTGFRYIHPEGPLADLQRYRNGEHTSSDGRANSSVFMAFLDEHSPRLLVLDGLNVLYGIHGHDTNEAAATSMIFAWLDRLTRGHQTTVLVIDHTGKNGGAGASPVGAHQKIAQVRGSALRTEVIPGHRPVRGKDGGQINLIVFKDSPGAVRAVSASVGDNEQVAAVVFIDSAPEDKDGVVRPAGSVIVRIEKPSAGASANITVKMPEGLGLAAERQDQIVALFGNDPEKALSYAQITFATKIPDGAVRKLCGELCAQDRLNRHGVTNQTTYKLGEREGGHVRG